MLYFLWSVYLFVTLLMSVIIFLQDPKDIAASRKGPFSSVAGQPTLFRNITIILGILFFLLCMLINVVIAKDRYSILQKLQESSVSENETAKNAEESLKIMSDSENKNEVKSAVKTTSDESKTSSIQKIKSETKDVSTSNKAEASNIVESKDIDKIQEVKKNKEEVKDTTDVIQESKEIQDINHLEEDRK